MHARPNRFPVPLALLLAGILVSSCAISSPKPALSATPADPTWVCPGLPLEAIAPIVGPEPEIHSYRKSQSYAEKCRVLATEERYKGGGVRIKWGPIKDFTVNTVENPFRGDESIFEGPGTEIFSISGLVGQGSMVSSDNSHAYAAWQCLEGAVDDSDIGFTVNISPPAIDEDRRNVRQDVINLIILLEPFVCETQSSPKPLDPSS